MANQLVDILKQPTGQLELCVGDTSTSVRWDRPNNSFGLGFAGVDIKYDAAQFRANPDSYTVEQLDAHRRFSEALDSYVHTNYGALEAQLAPIREWDRITQFIRPDSTRIVRGTARVLLNGYFLVKERKTLKTAIQQRGNELGIAQAFYEHFFKRITEQGQHMLTECADSEEATPAISENLRACATIANNLSYKFACLADTTKNEIKANTRFYQMLYPHN